MDDAPVRSDKAPWEDMHLVDKSEVVAEHTNDNTTNMSTDEATSLSESDAYVPETYQDYTMPIKVNQACALSSSSDSNCAASDWFYPASRSGRNND